MRSTTPSCASAVEASRKPERSNHASTPSASQNAPIALTLSDEASAAASARSGPKRSTSSGRLLHSVSQKPPLRPLGPWPQTSASSTTTLAPRPSSCHAVQSPA
jgi:hypothetical protein